MRLGGAIHSPAVAYKSLGMGLTLVCAENGPISIRNSREMEVKPFYCS